MEYPYPDLPDVPRISLLDEHAVNSSLGEDSQWHIDAHDTLLKGICMLRQDHESGAKELATTALGVLLDVAKVAGAGLSSSHERIGKINEEEVTTRMWKYTIRRCGWVIARYGRPTMDAAITTAIVTALQRIVRGIVEEDTRSKPLSIHESVQILRNQVQFRQSARSGTEVGVQLRKFIRDEFDKSAVNFPGNLEVTILTLSSSSTIKKALGTLLELEMEAEQHQEARRHLRIELRIMESRPLYEGVSMARELVTMAEKSGYTHMLQIEVASDASVAMLARNVDIVMLGADRISGSGDVSNKIGSLPAVLCAKVMSNHARVVTISELEKVAKPEQLEERGVEGNDVAELTDAWGSNNKNIIETRPGSCRNMVRVRNVYFEWVPAQYIHCYVCEDGALTVNGVKERSIMALEAEREMFSDFDSGTRIP